MKDLIETLIFIILIGWLINGCDNCINVSVDKEVKKYCVGVENVK